MDDACTRNDSRSTGFTLVCMRRLVYVVYIHSHTHTPKAMNGTPSRWSACRTFDAGLKNLSLATFFLSTPPSPCVRYVGGWWRERRFLVTASRPVDSQQCGSSFLSISESAGTRISLLLPLLSPPPPSDSFPHSKKLQQRVMSLFYC